MAHQAKRIAQWFVDRAIRDVEMNGGEFMSHLKLQKMLYYAQGCNGAMYDERLFDEEIVNWAHGPVVEEIYQIYKTYGDKGINKKTGGVIFDTRINAVLEEVYDVFGRFSAWGLREMTHEEDPWKNTQRGKTIPYDTIVDYFKREVIE